MATGENQTHSTIETKEPGVVYDFLCGPCGKDGDNVEAVNYCQDCQALFCTSCTSQHQKFGLGHTIVDRNLAEKHLAGKMRGPPKSDNVGISDVCEHHNGDGIISYCADHDLVLCNNCVTHLHRLCTGVSYIPHIASESKTNKNVDIIKQQITDCLVEIIHVKLSVRRRLVTVDENKETQLNHIRNFTERLIKHARNLEKAAVADVNDHHKITADNLRSGVASLDDAATAMKERLKSLYNIHKNSDSQVFVDTKRGHQQVEEARQLQQRLKKLWTTGNDLPEFKVRSEVAHLLKVESLGRYVGKNAYRVTQFDGEYNVHTARDKAACNIRDSCELFDGTILITDFNNQCIKKLDRSYKVTKRLNMPSWPACICQINQDKEVAVTLTQEKKVQIVNVKGNLSLTRSFKVEDNCRGICYNKGQLFVCIGGHTGNLDWAIEGPGFVGVYDTSGSLLRKIDLDRRGRQIFSMPVHITAADNGNKIHIADSDGGVISVDGHGNLLSTISDHLKGSTGICTITDDDFLVCSRGSNNVLHVNASGTLFTELLNKRHGIIAPWSVVFLKDSFKLLVTQDDSDKIKVFSMSVY